MSNLARSAAAAVVTLATLTVLTLSKGDPGIVNIVSVASLAGPGRLRHLVRDVRCRDDGLRQRLGLTASALLGWRNDLAGRRLFDVPGEGRVWADGAA